MYQGSNLRDEAVRGWKGAAFAALGEMVVAFFAAEVPFPERIDGVKLGESTLKRFLLLFASLGHLSPTRKDDSQTYLSDWFAALSFCGS